MTNLSREILDSWQLRKSKKQKSAFIELIQSRIPEAKVEGKGSTRNIVIGDADSAKVLFTAHYDTCALMPLPNFITPKRIVFYIIYQLFLVALILAIAVGCGFALAALSGDSFLGYWGAYMAFWLLLILLIAGPANKHTANDNTSGVITVLESYFAMTEAQRANCAFVLFDKEEVGLIGSAAFKKLHKHSVADKLLINFDCVSDGDHLLFVKAKKLPQELAQILENAFLPEESKHVFFESAAKCFYPSDQKHFPYGVGVAAMNKAPLLGYYMNRIHTPRDTVFDERNIELLRSGALRLAEEIAAEEKVAV